MTTKEQECIATRSNITLSTVTGGATDKTKLTRKWEKMSDRISESASTSKDEPMVHAAASSSAWPRQTKQANKADKTNTQTSNQANNHMSKQAKGQTSKHQQACSSSTSASVGLQLTLGLHQLHQQLLHQ